MANTEFDKEEKDFWRNRQWTSFKAAILSALSTATFIGVLAKLVTMAVEAAGVGENAATAAATFSSPFTMGVIGVALAAGAAFTYFAQNEWTDLKVLEDDHLAKRNAQCHAQEKAKAQAIVTHIEHEVPGRSDGKSWSQAVSVEAGQQVRIH